MMVKDLRAASKELMEELQVSDLFKNNDALQGNEKLESLKESIEEINNSIKTISRVFDEKEIADSFKLKLEEATIGLKDDLTNYFAMGDSDLVKSLAELLDKLPNVFSKNSGQQME